MNCIVLAIVALAMVVLAMTAISGDSSQPCPESILFFRRNAMLKSSPRTRENLEICMALEGPRLWQCSRQKAATRPLQKSDIAQARHDDNSALGMYFRPPSRCSSFVSLAKNSRRFYFGTSALICF
jgi:hypothetical protein